MPPTTGTPEFDAHRRTEPSGRLNSVGFPIGLAVLGGCLMTLFVSLVPVIHFAYANLSLHVALVTGEALIAGLLAFLAVQRFRAKGTTRDAVLAWTFAVFALTNLVHSAILIVAPGAPQGGTLSWAIAALRFVGAPGLCIAAYIPATRHQTLRRIRPRLAVGMCSVALFVVLFSAGAGAWLGEPVDPSLSPESSSRPFISGHPLVLAIHFAAMALFAAAAVGFRRGVSSQRDELLQWLAAGATLAAFARLNFILFPSLYLDWVYTGDLLRVGSYLCFLVGGTREITAYRNAQLRLAVMQERRRMARDMHDGLLQELSFIRSQLSAMAGGMRLPPGMPSHLAGAAQRAIDETRRAIDALAGTGRLPFADALRGAAEEVAERAGVAVKVTGQGGSGLPEPLREALLRVVREATSNAVRHGRAETVSIRVEQRGDSLRLAIRDDGEGFDPELAASLGFGLTSMRERTENLGGVFTVRSEPGAGAVVEVTVPCPRS